MARRDHSDLTLAVIHFQTPELLERCLESLRSAAPRGRIIVVDTGEQEPLPDEWAPSHPGVELLREANHSYSAAVNAALRRCRTVRFAQMNADVVVRPETFDDLAAALEASGAAMAGPLARDGRGRLQRNGLPYRWHQWRAHKSGGWHYAPWLSGCLQYLRCNAVERVGGMDTTLRFYNEDMEWCLRLRSVGERCALVDSEIVHLGGSSTSASSLPLIEGLRGGYLLSRRYRGPFVRGLHRWAVMALAAVLAVAARLPEQRLAYRQVALMLWRRDVDESPFGATLGSQNSHFLQGAMLSKATLPETTLREPKLPETKRPGVSFQESSLQESSMHDGAAK
ncbi:MAG: glycosyltransferase [Trueperaceae bacterium]